MCIPYKYAGDKTSPYEVLFMSATYTAENC